MATPHLFLLILIRKSVHKSIGGVPPACRVESQSAHPGPPRERTPDREAATPAGQVIEPHISTGNERRSGAWKPASLVGHGEPCPPCLINLAPNAAPNPGMGSEVVVCRYGTPVKP